MANVKIEMEREIARSLEKSDRRFRDQHLAAMGAVSLNMPHPYPLEKSGARRMELGLVAILKGLAEYAQGYQETMGGAGIGTDYVLGDYWMDIAAGLKGLLDGERGRLDGGTVDGSIRAIARAAGYTDSEVDNLKTEAE